MPTSSNSNAENLVLTATRFLLVVILGLLVAGTSLLGNVDSQLLLSLVNQHLGALFSDDIFQQIFANIASLLILLFVKDDPIRERRADGLNDVL